MNLLPLNFPPGMFRNGTNYQSKGRWYDGNLVRWVRGVMQAIGGWLPFGAGFQQDENLLLRSFQLGTSPWSVGAGSLTTDEDKVNHFDPAEETLTATEVTDPGSTAAAYLTQTLGTLTNSEETLSFVLEKISGATVTDIEIHDATAGSPVLRLRLTWSTLAVAADDTTAGSSESVSVNHMGTGPYGGDMVRVIATVTPDNNGNDRAIRFFPTGADAAEAGVVMVHHAQHVEDDAPGIVIFTTDAAASANSFRVSVDGPILGMFAWRDNSAVQRLAVGTTCQAWTYADGTIVDITPSSMTCGTAKATTQSGIYGAGAYGVGLYGAGDDTLEQLVEAQSWQFDAWGQYLLGMAVSDGRLLEWQLDGGTPFEVVSNAPTGNDTFVVTPERFVMILGAGGDARKVQWCDQEDNTVWTPSTSNQAGDFLLPGSGALLCARRGRRETLLWTTVDMFVAQYVAGELIYSFRSVGTNCGPISRRAVAMMEGGRAIWMGSQNFYRYDGVVSEVPSEVQDAVFSSINRQQRSLVHAVTTASAGEVTWYYPSAGSNFCNRYVTYNLYDNVWYTGELQRNAGVDRGVFTRPFQADRYGVVYEHERGTAHDDFLGEAITPYAESGPIEIGPGEKVMFVRSAIPDENTQGGVSVTLSSRLYPNAAVLQTAEYTPANPTDMRISGRQISLTVQEVTPGWRFGILRLDVDIGGER